MTLGDMMDCVNDKQAIRIYVFDSAGDEQAHKKFSGSKEAINIYFEKLYFGLTVSNVCTENNIILITCYTNEW